MTPGDREGERQTDTGALDTTLLGVGAALELLPDPAPVAARDADPVVLDVDHDLFPALGYDDLDPPVRRRRVFPGVREEVEDHLDDRVPVDRDGRHVLDHLDLDREGVAFLQLELLDRKSTRLNSSH